MRLLLCCVTMITFAVARDCFAFASNSPYDAARSSEHHVCMCVCVYVCVCVCGCFHPVHGCERTVLPLSGAVFVCAASPPQNFPGVVIIRCKDRFSTPSSGGWRDCMLNLFFEDDSLKFICELQLIHNKLMLARQGMAGHNDYNTYRSANELAEIVSYKVRSVSYTHLTLPTIYSV